MTPRELDALVAEKVMGLVPCTATWHRTGAGLPCHAHPSSPDDGGETLAYSTDTAAAFEVVEKMRENGWLWELLSLESGDWEAAVSDANWDTYWVTRPLLPKAICLAALRAKGGA